VSKIRKRGKFYYLWLAVDKQGMPEYADLTAKRDSWTAQVKHRLRLTWSGIK